MFSYFSAFDLGEILILRFTAQFWPAI